MISLAAELARSDASVVPERDLCLLIELPPWRRVFFENLRDTLLGRTVQLGFNRYPPAQFWPDVFVQRGVSWARMRQSLLGHAFVVLAVYGLVSAWITDRRLHPEVRVHRITNFDISEYLPPLDTGSAPAVKPRTGQPRLAKQKIISLPPNPDNHEQTIITPPNVKLPTNVPLPNIVAWTAIPGLPTALAKRENQRVNLPDVPTEVIAPAPDPVARDLAKMRIETDHSVIAPPPDAQDLQSTRKLEAESSVIGPPPTPDLAKLNPRAIVAPPPSVIEPAPDANTARNLATMNVGNLAATVAAPKLEVAAQRAIPIRSGTGSMRQRAGAGSGSASPPINPVTGVAGPDAGQLIALNVNPAVPNGPLSVPPGRRSGEFAVGPEGKPDAPGTPEVESGSSGTGAGAGKTTNPNLPQGITIGEAPRTSGGSIAGDPANKNLDLKEVLMASARPSRVGDIAREARPNSPSASIPKIEDRIFGSRRTYKLALNMPNLISSGGSWIIRFAELTDDRSGIPVSAPIALNKVDPAYPAELMRDGVEGTVVLYAVIHSDGNVGDVRVLRGLQRRLDENARIALEHWKFKPGTKNGEAVALEAVVEIPFKAAREPAF
jgi:TonB family protein